MTVSSKLMSREEAQARVISRNANRGGVEVSVSLSTYRLAALGLAHGKARMQAADDLLEQLAVLFTPEKCEVEFLKDDRGEHVIVGQSVQACAAAAEAISRIGI